MISHLAGRFSRTETSVSSNRVGLPSTGIMIDRRVTGAIPEVDVLSDYFGFCGKGSLFNQPRSPACPIRGRQCLRILRSFTLHSDLSRCYTAVSVSGNQPGCMRIGASRDVRESVPTDGNHNRSSAVQSAEPDVVRDGVCGVLFTVYAGCVAAGHLHQPGPVASCRRSGWHGLCWRRFYFRQRLYGVLSIHCLVPATIATLIDRGEPEEVRDGGRGWAWSLSFVPSLSTCCAFRSQW